MKEFTEQLKRQAEALGFVLNGVALAAMPGRLQQFHAWLDSGQAAEMHYFEDRRQAYQHPEHVLDGCKSLLMLGLPYLTQPQQKSRSEAQPGRGLVARYAQGGADYHDVIYSRLKELIQWTRAASPRQTAGGSRHCALAGARVG